MEHNHSLEQQQGLKQVERKEGAKRKEEKEKKGMGRTLASALECIRSRFPLGFAVANGASAASHASIASADGARNRCVPFCSLTTSNSHSPAVSAVLGRIAEQVLSSSMPASAAASTAS